MITQPTANNIETVLNLYKNSHITLDQAQDLLHAVFSNEPVVTDYPNNNGWFTTTTMTTDESISIK